MSTFTLGVGVLVGIGGLIGYLKAKSIPSLVAGSVFGLVFLYCGYQLSQNPYDNSPHKLALVASLVLAFTMSKRYLASKKFMPAGLMAVVSSLSIIVHFLALM